LDTIGKGGFKSKQKCRDFFSALISAGGLDTTVGALMGQAAYMAGVAAANGYVYDGPSSKTALTNTDFPNSAGPGVSTVGDWFNADSRRIALSQFSGAAIFIRTDQWLGWTSSFPSGGKVGNYGLGTLLHEILHKQLVGGSPDTHDIMDDALRAVCRNPTDWGGQNGRSREIGQIGF
jgi:hypothetical protein